MRVPNRKPASKASFGAFPDLVRWAPGSKRKSRLMSIRRDNALVIGFLTVILSVIGLSFSGGAANAGLLYGSDNTTNFAPGEELGGLGGGNPQTFLCGSTQFLRAFQVVSTNGAYIVGLRGFCQTILTSGSTPEATAVGETQIVVLNNSWADTRSPNCDSSSLVSGLRVVDNGYVDDLGVVCENILTRAKANSGPFWNQGTVNASYQCPAGQFVVGLNARTGGGVDGITGVICRSLTYQLATPTVSNVVDNGASLTVTIGNLDSIANTRYRVRVYDGADTSNATVIAEASNQSSSSITVSGSELYCGRAYRVTAESTGISGGDGTFDKASSNSAVFSKAADSNCQFTTLTISANASSNVRITSDGFVQAITKNTTGNLNVADLKTRLRDGYTNFRATNVDWQASAPLVMDAGSCGRIDSQHPSGTVTLASPIDTTACSSGNTPGNIALTGGAITTTSGAVIVGKSSVTLNSSGTSGVVTIGGSITAPSISFTTQKIAINAALTATSTVTVSQSNASTAINLGSTSDSASNTIEISDAELDRISTPTLRIGVTSNTGSITVSQAISPAQVTSLVLRTGGSVGVSGSGSISATNLGVVAVGAINLSNDNSVTGNLALNTSGAVTYNQTVGTFTPANVDVVTAQYGIPSKVTLSQVPVGSPVDESMNVNFNPPPVATLADKFDLPLLASNARSTSYTITATKATGPGALSGTTSRTTSSGGVATFDDLRVITSTGEHTITFTATAISPATIVGTPSATTGTYNVRTPQTITFGPLANRDLGANNTFTVTATADSGLDVTFSSDTTSICTTAKIDANTIVTMLDGGTCRILANQAGNSSFAPAAQVQQEFVITVVHEITFDSNGGTGSMDPQVIPQGVTTALNANVFTRNGYVFRGWNSAANGTGALSVSNQGDVTRSADLTLYAMWTSLEDRAWNKGNLDGEYAFLNNASDPVIPKASNAAWTVEAWVRPDSHSATWSSLFAQQDDLDTHLSNRNAIWLNNGEVVLVSPSDDEYTGYTLPLNQWTHIAWAMTTTTSHQLYVNGQPVLAANATILRNAASGTHFALGGARQIGHDSFDGNIDQFKIWGTNLSQSQVTNSMHNHGATFSGAPTASCTTGLRAHFDFNEFVPGTVTDRSGCGRHLAFNSVGTSYNEANFTSAAIVTNPTSAHSLQTFVQFNRSYLTAAGGWTPPSDISKFKALIVGGGGAGGTVAAGSSGGGGGGQVQESTLSRSGSNPLAVVVGVGGMPTPTEALVSSQNSGGNGGSSSISILGSSVLSSLGGGGGANSRVYNTTQGTGSTSGWTGGGGAAHAGTRSLGSSGLGGSALKGGDAHAHSTLADPQAAGGGGGAGGAGVSAASGAAGAGGVGVSSRLSGSTLTYGGGGGGGKRTSSGSAGAGGQGGGGAGAKAGASAGDGQAGTGGGGGGAGEGADQIGGLGGSGIVILSYGPDLQVTRTATTARAGSNFSQSIQVTASDGSPDMDVTVSATGQVLRVGSSGAAVTSVTVRTDSSGVATFTDLGFTSNVGVGARSLTFSSDAFIETSMTITPSQTALTVNITGSGSTTGTFVNGQFESSTDGTANILNTDLQTHMQTFSTTVESRGTISVQADISSSAVGNGLTLRAKGRITVSAGASAASPGLIGTASGPITFWTTGSDGGVTLGNFTQLNTTQSGSAGADITIGGGSALTADTSRPSGAASSTSTHGVQIGARTSSFQTDDFVVRAGTGHFSLKGAYTGTATGVYSGIQFRPGFNILAGTVTIDGQTSSTNSTASQSGIDTYWNAGSIKSLIEATKSFSTFETAISISGSSGNTSGILLGPSNSTTDYLTFRTSGDKAGISISGSNSRANSAGVWMASVTIETKNGQTVVDSGDDDLYLGGDSGRIFTFKPVTGETGGDLTITTQDLLSSTHMSLSTAGSVTFSPSSTTFDAAETFPTSSSTVSVGSLMVGSNTNTSDLTVGAVVQSTSSVTYRGGTITQSFNVTSDTGNVTFAAADNIIIQAGDSTSSKTSIQTNGGEITVQSDSDGNNDGYIWIQNFTNISTGNGGGDILISGGSDPTTGFATAASGDGTNRAGILFGTFTSNTPGYAEGITLASGTGDVTLRGKAIGNSQGRGILLPLSSTTANKSSVTGANISFVGSSESTGTWYGLEFGPSSGQSEKSIKTLLSATEQLTLNGTSSNYDGIVAKGNYEFFGERIEVIGSGPRRPIALWVSANRPSTIEAGAGGFSYNATKSGTVVDNDTDFQPGSLTSTGPVSFVFDASTSTTASLSLAAPISVTNTEVTVRANNVQLESDGAINAGTGGVTFEPHTSSRAITLGTEVSSTLSLTSTELGVITAATLRLETGGNLNVTSNLTFTNKVSTLAIRAGGNVTAASDLAVVVANLGIDAGGNINWPGTGHSAAVIALSAGASGSVSFGQSANYSVAAVDGIDPEFGQGVKFIMEGVDRTNTVDRFMAVTFNPPPVVKIQDKFGNVLATNNDSAADYTVTAAMTVTGSSNGTPTLDGNTTTSSGGTHTYTNLRVIDGTGAVSISFTVTRDSDSFSLVDAESSDTPQATAVVINYLVKAGFPSSIVVSMGSSTFAGKTGLSPTATLKDSSGGTLTSGEYANATVTVAVSTDTQRIQIESGGSAQASSGVASFPNLVVGGLIGSNYVLTFSVQYLDSNNVTQTVTRDSGVFTVVPGDATALSVDSSSQTVASRVNLSDIVVTVEDAYGNPFVSSTSRPISLAVGTGANGSAQPTLVGYNATPVGTALNGSSATFTGLQLQGTVDSYDLTFSSSGVSSAVHRVDLTHGAATNLTITGPTNAANDKDFDTDVVVSIFDADANLVTTGPQSTQNIELSSATTLTGTREISATAGRATFTALRLIGLAGTKSIQAEVLAPSSITKTLSVQLGFGDATKLVLTTQAAGIANRTTFVTDPVITVQDSSGNTVTNYSVDIDVTEAAVGGVNGSLFGDVDIAPSTGVATFTDLELQGEVGQYDLTFTSGSLTATTQRVTLTHGAAFDVVVSGPSEADNAVDFGSDVSVVLRDQDQNIVTSGPDSSRSVVASNADANTALSGTTTVTATAGRATFTNLRLTGPVGAKTVALTWGTSPSIAANLSVELSHGVATQLVLTQDAATAASRAVFGTQPIVSVRDVSGNPVSDFVGRVTVDVSRAGTSVTFGLTGVTGVGLSGSPTATFTGVGLYGEVGTFTLTYSSTNLASATQTIVLGHGVATQLDLTTSAVGFVNRVAFATQPSITVRDQDGNPVLNYATDIEVTSAPVDVNANAEISGTLSRSPSSGIATFTNLRLVGKVGQHDLTFSSGNLAVATQRVSLTHGVATAVVLTGATTAANDRTFGSAVVVEIQDADANRVTTGASADQALTLSAVSADQSSVTLAGNTGLTVASGIATLSNLKLTGLAGTKTLTANVSTPSLSGTRDIELGHGYATKLVITQAASEAVSREAFGVQPVVTVQDVSGNPVSDFAGEVSAEVFRAGTAIPYALTGTITRTLSGSPTATFTNLGLFGQVGTYAITYRAVDDRTGLALSTVGQSISLAHGSATQVEVVAASTIANAAPLGDVTATIRDQDGNPVTTGTPEVVLSISGSTTVSLVGAAPVNAANGVATFSGVSILGLEEQKVLTATVASLSNLSGSANVDLTFGAATQLALISGVTEAVNRQPFASSTVIEARDSSGNPVDTFSGDVSVSATTGSGVVTGTLTKTATSSPRVTFSDLEIEGDVDSYALTFTSTGLASIAQAVELTHGEAHSLLLQMTTTAKNNEDIPDVVVRVLDEDQNLVTSGTPQITLSGADLTGTLVRNASGGIATFTTLRFVGDVATVKYVTATLASPSITSNQVTVTLSHGDATQMDLTTSGSGAVNRAGMTQVPVVTLRDISGNPVLDSTATVTVSETSVGSAAADISGTVSRTPVNGVVTFTGLGLNGQVGQYTLTFSTTGLTDITQSITLTHGVAVKLAIASSADTARSGIDFVAQPVVHVLDFDDNLVTTGDGSSATVTAALFGANPSEITLFGESGLKQVQASGGVAAFSTLRLTGDVATYTLDYTSGAFTKASQQIELLAGAPASLNILAGTGPANAIAGEGFAQAIEVELLDAEGNRVLSDSVSDITATLVSSSDVSSRGVTATTVRATNGLVSFDGGSALNYTLAGDHKISFTDGTRTEVSDSFTITHAAASKLVIQTQPASLRNDLAVSDGFGVAPALRVLDEFDNRVVSGPTITVTATVTGANSGDITSVSGGSVTTTSGTELVSMPDLKLRGLAGSYVLNFEATGSLTTFDIDSSSVSLTFGLPSQLVLTQSADVARSGAAFTPQPVVEVRDNSSNLVSDSQLVVTATVAGREMVGQTSQTASGGIATFSGLGVSGVAAQGVVLSFAADYLGTPLTTSQTIDVTAGDAVKFVIIEQPQTVKTRSTFTTSTALRLLDASDNPVPTDNSTFVSIDLLKGELTKAPAVATGGGPVTLTSARATEGVVRFVGLTLPVMPANDYYLEYSLGDFSLQSQKFEVQPGPVATIDINIEPSSATGSGPVATGELLPRQPEVTLYDADGYVALGASGTVSVAISSGANGNLTEGLTTTTVTNGVARFEGIRLVGTPEQQGVSAVNYRLRFSFTNELGNVITSEDSEVLNVTNTRASKLSVSRGAADGRAGSDFNTQPIVRLLDRYDNIVETGVDRNLEIIASAPGADQLLDNAVNALNGVATFRDLSLGGQVGTNYTLNFVVANRGDITSASQANVQVTFGSQAKIQIVTEPQSLNGSELTKSGQVLAVQPVIEILDAFDNRVTDSTREISVTLIRVGQTLDIRDRIEATVATPTNGVATFSGVKVIGRPGDSYQLVFSGSGFSNITSQSLVVRHGDPTSLEFVNQPVSQSGGVLTRTGALLPGQPKLRLVDFDGNVATEVNGDSVSAFVSRGGGSTVLEVNGVEKNTASFVNGEATFENLMVVATPGVDQFLGFETEVRGVTLQSPESAAISFQNAEAYQLAILTQACAGVVTNDVCEPGVTGDDLSVNPVIEIQDRFGNRAVDFNGVITVTTTNNRGQLSDLDLITVNEITVTAIAGVATFEDLNLVALPGEEVELLFTSGDLTSVTGAPITVRAAAAVSIAVETQPVGARTGSQLAIAPIVRLLDRFGNLAASDDTSRITVTVSAGTLVGTTTLTATAGRATFSDLSFTGIPGMVFSLTFTGVDGADAPLTGISSNGFTVKNAIADTLVITQQPSASRTGDLLGETVLELRDFDDNLAEDDSSTVVRVDIHGGDGNAYFVDGSDTQESYSSTSTLLRQAASGGVVRFSDLRVVGTPGVSYQLIFTANPDDVNAAYDSLPSSALVFTHAEPSQLEVTAWPVANLTDEPLTTQPALRLLDRYGNLATLDNQTVVTASVFGATGSVIRAGGSATSAAGIVTFDGLTVDGTPGELYQLRFTSGVITVDENVGFRLKKNADIAMRFDPVNFVPSASVNRDMSVTLTDSPGTPSYSTTSDASICTVNSSTGVVTVNGVGDCLVRVTIPDTTYYFGGSLNALLVINKVQQATLSMSSASTVPYLSTIDLAATGGSGDGRLIFSTSGDCRAVSGILIVGDAGSECLVRVDKLGDDNYVGQVSVFQEITITKLNQADLMIGNSTATTIRDIELFTHGGSGTGSVSYAVDPDTNPALCQIIDGNILRAGADGTCDVTATKAASTNYNVAPSAMKRFTFSKAKQNVVFTSTVPMLPLAGGELYEPVATATSGLAVTYAITTGNGTVCEFDSVETGKVRFLTSGNCEVTATQAGNARYVIATARQVIAVGLRNQTITFPAVEDRRFGQPAFMLAATASSGLAVSYQLDSNVSPQACTVTTAGLVSITQAGTCSIRASQAGDSTFQAAPDVFRSFTVAPDRAGAPHLVSVSASDQTITATFTAPSYLGGSTITRYRMEVSMVGTDNVYVNFACQANPLVPCRLAGLPNANDESYTVKVAAVTAAGVGAYSRSSDPLSTAIANAAVSNLTASSTSSTLSLAWDEPIAVPGTFESYDVYVWPMNDSNVPANPTLEVTDASQLSAQISITAPSGGFQSFRTSAPSVIRSDGYNIKVVTITNTLSAALPENTSTGMKLGATTPGSPSAVELTDMTEMVMVGWSAPTFDGGHAILGYQVMVNGEVSCVLEAAASSQQVCRDSDERIFELADIEVGVNYNIEIAAVNELGIGSMANVTHLIPLPTVSGGSGGALPEVAKPGIPSKPAKPDTGISGPNVFDTESWKPGVADSVTDPDASEPTEPSGPIGPADGSDTSASGTDSSEANFTWLMVLIALAMSLVLLRVVIRGRKRKVLG